MSRCVGCNTIMYDGELSTINARTGEYEDLCRVCRESSLDGIVYTTDKQGYSTGVEYFINESCEYEREFVGGGGSGMSGEYEIVEHILNNGFIGTENDK